MAGREVPVTWNGRTVRAWVPEPLESRDFSLREPTVRRTEQAIAMARRANDELPLAWEALARLLLRAEGVASSCIEGVTAPLADVAAAELDRTIGETASWVADNLEAVGEGRGGHRSGPPRTARRRGPASLASHAHGRSQPSPRAPHRRTPRCPGLGATSWPPASWRVGMAKKCRNSSWL